MRSEAWRCYARAACGRTTAIVVCAIAVASTGVSPVSGAPTRTTSASGCASPAAIARWPLSRLVAAAVVDPVDVGSVTSVGSEVAGGVGGVILTGSDASSELPRQLAALLERAPSGDAPFVMVDEEGGSVQRLVKLTGSLPSARTMAETMSTKAIEALARGLGSKLRALGVTMDLAPVLDLDAGAGPNDADADGTRSFSVTAAVAAADGVGFGEGLLAAKVVPVMKHFPGLGDATGNTDLEPASTRPYAGPGEDALQPFLAGIRAGLPAVMVANASVPGLSTAPASVAPHVIEGLLRSKLGFKGLVLTDSLSVPSISKAGYGLGAAAVAALEAGADEVLFNALPGATAADTAIIETAVTRAVVERKLTRARLVRSAQRALAAKALVRAC